MIFETQIRNDNSVVEFEFDIAKGNKCTCHTAVENTIFYSADNVDSVDASKLVKVFKSLSVVRDSNNLYGYANTLIDNVIMSLNAWADENASELNRASTPVKSESVSKPSNKDGKILTVQCDRWNGFNVNLYYYDNNDERQNTSINNVDYDKFISNLNLFLNDEFENLRGRHIPNNYGYEGYVLSENAELFKGEIMELTDRANKVLAEPDTKPKYVEIKFSPSRDAYYATVDFVDENGIHGREDLSNKSSEDIMFKVTEFINGGFFNDRCNIKRNVYNYIGYTGLEEAMDVAYEYHNSEEYKKLCSAESQTTTSSDNEGMVNFLYNKEILKLPVETQRRVYETGGKYLDIAEPVKGYANHHVVPYNTCMELSNRAVFMDNHELAAEYMSLACNNDNVVQLPKPLHNKLHSVASDVLSNLYVDNGRVFISKSDIPQYLVEMVLIFTDLCREYNDCFDDLDSLLVGYVIKSMSYLNEYVDLNVYYELMDMHLVDYKNSMVLYNNVENVFGLIKSNCL